MFIGLNRIAVKVNKIYFDSKMIRKLYFKSSKKGDDVLQGMINNKRKRQETDPIFMKPIKFSLRDYIGGVVMVAKNMLQRRKRPSLNQQ